VSRAGPSLCSAARQTGEGFALHEAQQRSGRKPVFAGNSSRRHSSALMVYAKLIESFQTSIPDNLPGNA
jgi:hypothetical protein